VRDGTARERAMRARWARRRRKAIAYGTWQPFVDPEPVREHVRSLRAFGLSFEAIATMAGEHPSALSTLMQEANSAYLTQIRPERAQAYLAVRFDLDAVPDQHRVAGVGTARRIGALMRIGYSGADIARRLDVTLQAVAQYRNRPRLAAATARRVRDLYDELWDTPGRSVKAIRWAERHGWAPPLAWDDDTIDDPSAEPNVGTVVRLARGATPSADTADNVRDVLTWEPLATSARVADRLGMTVDAITQALGRAGASDLRDQLNRNARLAGHGVDEEITAKRRTA
jgi:hypothetical protein